MPAAIAWACNPQAHISLDRTSYAPGSTITIYGQYFTRNTTVTVSGPTGSKQVTTSGGEGGGGGSFVTTLTAPGNPGNYTISASRPTGGFAPASFRVAAPAAQPAPQAAPESPGASRPNSPSFRDPSIVRSERAPTTTGGGGGGSGGGPGAQVQPGTPGAGGGGTVVVTPAGQPAFAGSVAPASTGSFATIPGTAATGTPAAGAAGRSSAPSEQVATGDVWSGFSAGQTPSLTSAADGVPEDGTGSELGWGLGLLALGLLALVAGLTAAEVRRRRTA